jgi:exonuclease I
MWKRKRKAEEWLPWYRARNYKGDLTEAEKRQFDAFRMQPKHPADHDLPEEVRNYIIRWSCTTKSSKASPAERWFIA